MPTVTKLQSFDGTTNTVETVVGGTTTTIPRTDLVYDTDFMNGREVERQVFDYDGSFVATASGTDVSMIYRSESQQREFYIAPSPLGSDSNDGLTPATPWLTWAKALAEPVGGGDIVYLMDGTHTNLLSGSTRTMTLNGSADAPLVVKAYTGATPNIVYVSWSGQYAVFEGISGSYGFSRVDHFLIKDCTFSSTTTTWNIITLHEKYEDIVIYGCDLSNVSGGRSVIDCLAVESVLIQSNEIYNGNRAIQIKAGALNVVVEGNLIHDCDDGAVVATSVSLKAGCTAHGSDYINDPSTPIADRYNAKDVIIRNNVIHDMTGFACIRAGGWVDFKVYNNTFIDINCSHVILVERQQHEFIDATALAHSPCISCDPPCDTGTCAVCNNIWLPSGNGDIRMNIAQNINGQNFLKVDSYSTQPGSGLTTDYNIIDDAGYPNTTTPSDAYTISGVDYTLANYRVTFGEAANTALQTETLDPLDNYSGGSAGGVLLVVFDYDWSRRGSAAFGAH